MKNDREYTDILVILREWIDRTILLFDEGREYYGIYELGKFYEYILKLWEDEVFNEDEKEKKEIKELIE